jgi:type IV pilus assembly protein PilB
MNMGIEPFLVATSVQLIAAQRLARRICQNCKEVVEVAPQALINLGYKKEEIGSFSVYKGRGCEKCNNTGYKGRVGLIEVMVIDDDLRELILSGGTAIDIKRKANDNGMISLRRSGLTKIKDGITTIEEVVRETVL